MKNVKLHLIWFLLILIMAMFVILFTSCSVTKKSQTDTNVKETTREQILTDSLHLMKSENDRLTSEISQLQYAGVVFNTDTVNHHDTITNTVEITKEGAIKATGNIGSAYVSKSFYSKLIAEKDKRYDSLLKKKQEVLYITKTIDTHTTTNVKRSLLNFWWLLIVGAVFGIFIHHKTKNSPIWKILP